MSTTTTPTTSSPLPVPDLDRHDPRHPTVVAIRDDAREVLRLAAEAGMIPTEDAQFDDDQTGAERDARADA